MKRLLVEVAMLGNRLALVPADPLAEEDIAGLDRSQSFMVQVTAGRRRGPLNKWWAGLALLHANLPEHLEKRWPTTRKLHDAFLEEMGFVTRLYRIDGSWREEVDSVALDAMEDAEFGVLQEKARALCIKVFGYDAWQAWEDEQEAKKAMRRRA
jgi:hypothetical protein